MLVVLLVIPEGFDDADLDEGELVLSPAFVAILVLVVVCDLVGVFERVALALGLVFGLAGEDDCFPVALPFCKPELVLEAGEFDLCDADGPLLCGTVLCFVTEFWEVVDLLEGDSERCEVVESLDGDSDLLADLSLWALEVECTAEGREAEEFIFL